MDSSEEAEVARNLGIPRLTLFVAHPVRRRRARARVVMQAAMAVATGVADVVVCYRAFNERSGMRFGGPADGGRPRCRRGSTWYGPYGLLSPASWVALHARRYMHEYGVTNEDFGRIVGGRSQARGDQPRTRGSTSARSRSRTTRARAGSSSRCCGCSTAARRATAASRWSSPRPSARAICARRRR